MHLVFVALVNLASARGQRDRRRRSPRRRRWLHSRWLRSGLHGFGLQHGGRLLHRWAGQHLLSDVLIDGLQCSNVLGHLVLLCGQLFQAASYDLEIGCQRRKLLHWVSGSCSHDWRPRRRNGQQLRQAWRLGGQHAPCHITIGLPGERAADADENHNEKTGNGTEESSAKRRPVARHRTILAARGIWKTDRRIVGRHINAPVGSGVNVARTPVAQKIFKIQIPRKWWAL
jgi:hypothetical protein